MLMLPAPQVSRNLKACAPFKRFLVLAQGCTACDAVAALLPAALLSPPLLPLRTPTNGTNPILVCQALPPLCHGKSAFASGRAGLGVMLARAAADCFMLKFSCCSNCCFSWGCNWPSAVKDIISCGAPKGMVWPLSTYKGQLQAQRLNYDSAAPT